MYKCVKCGEMFDDFPKGKISCPTCAFKIVFKRRDPVSKVIQGR